MSQVDLSSDHSSTNPATMAAGDTDIDAKLQTTSSPPLPYGQESQSVVHHHHHHPYYSTGYPVRPWASYTPIQPPPPYTMPAAPMATSGCYLEPSMQPQTFIHYHPPGGNSPDSLSASPQTPPAAAMPGYYYPAALVTPLNGSSEYTNPTTERVKETIARANSVPVEFYHTEFHEYSKEAYERNKRQSNKRKRQQNEEKDNKKKKVDDDEDQDKKESLSAAELRRQIHIQSEQKRRAQIKDGFDELRKHLPGCNNNKKMSKAALLVRTVQQMQHLKSIQMELLEQVERLMQENENLKKFQHSVLQRQAAEKMYTF